MRRTTITRSLAILLLFPLLAPAQQEEKKPSEQPPVRVNIMNVCAPPEADQKEIAAALNRIPARPKLGADFEIARGRTTLEGDSAAKWVRVRRDFAPDTSFATAQYSFSDDANGLVETLVVRPRESKDVVQVSIEDSVSGGQGVATVLASDTPPHRIKVERFGKPSLGLDRCPNANQGAYEPMFHRAAELMTAYRSALGVRTLVPAEYARLAARAPASRKAAAAKK